MLVGSIGPLPADRLSRLAALAFALVLEGVEHPLRQKIEIRGRETQHSKVPLALTSPPDLVF